MASCRQSSRSDDDVTQWLSHSLAHTTRLRGTASAFCFFASALIISSLVYRAHLGYGDVRAFAADAVAVCAFLAVILAIKSANSSVLANLLRIQKTQQRGTRRPQSKTLSTHRLV